VLPASSRPRRTRNECAGNGQDCWRQAFYCFATASFQSGAPEVRTPGLRYMTFGLAIFLHRGGGCRLCLTRRVFRPFCGRRLLPSTFWYRGSGIDWQGRLSLRERESSPDNHRMAGA